MKRTLTLFWNDNRSTIEKPFAEFSEASAGRHDTLAQEYFFDSRGSNWSLVQKRLSIYNLNPDVDVEERALVRNKSQASGISSHSDKATPQKNLFLEMEHARIWDTERVDDHIDKNTIDNKKHKINTKTNNVYSDLKHLVNT